MHNNLMLKSLHVQITIIMCLQPEQTNDFFIKVHLTCLKLQLDHYDMEKVVTEAKIAIIYVPLRTLLFDLPFLNY